MRNIVILGTGGNCVDILETILDINDAATRPLYQCIGFLDDDPARHGESLHGVPVIGGLKQAGSIADALFVNGIGSPRNYWRKPEIIASTGLADDRFVSIVHPSARVSRFASVGVGTVILQNSVINSNARIGRHVVILPLSVVIHDCVIGDYATIAGGVCVSARARIGRASYLGSNSSIIGDVSVGERCLVGMGSVVLKDVADGAVVAGSPARVLRRQS
jgi:sugar O-acyltransferase (sialic acid O-acetyltransferase NeuD family)